MTAVHDAALASRWISQLMGGLAGKTPAEKHNSNVQADDELNDAGSRDSPRRRIVQKGRQNLGPRSVPPPMGSLTSAGAVVPPPIGSPTSAGAVMAAGTDSCKQVPRGQRGTALPDAVHYLGPGQVPKLPPRPRRARPGHCKSRVDETGQTSMHSPGDVAVLGKCRDDSIAEMALSVIRDLGKGTTCEACVMHEAQKYRANRKECECGQPKSHRLVKEADKHLSERGSRSTGTSDLLTITSMCCDGRDCKQHAMRGLARNGTTCDTRNVNVSMVPTAGVAADRGHMESKSAAMGFSMEAGKPAVEHEKQCMAMALPVMHDPGKGTTCDIMQDAQKYRADCSECECDNPDSESTDSPDKSVQSNSIGASSEITHLTHEAQKYCAQSPSVYQLVKEYEKYCATDADCKTPTKVGKGRGASSTALAS